MNLDYTTYFSYNLHYVKSPFQKEIRDKGVRTRTYPTGKVLRILMGAKPPFMDLHSIPDFSYIHGADEGYVSPLHFESTKEYVEELETKDKFHIDSEILVVELDEGVYIRCTNIEVCRHFDLLCNIIDKDIRFAKLQDGEFTRLTRKYKEPLNLFGNQGLAIWRAGFK
jgi:hypothetical protein